jgi:hypothetical protein
MRQILVLFIGFAIQLSSAYAQEKAEVGDWKIQSKGVITEAYTAPNPESTFGLFCSAEKCIFYLHQALTCKPNTKYSVLLNSLNVATSIRMTCTQVGADLFWILSPFDTVLKATQAGDQVGFAVALQSGAFAVSRFSLDGATKAINESLVLAARKKPAPPAIAPQPPAIKKIEPPKASKRDIET